LRGSVKTTAKRSAASFFRQFVVLCQRLDLFAEALVAIDGSKFKAVNHRDRNFTSAKLERRMRDELIGRFVVGTDT
jgi:transposase